MSQSAFFKSRDCAVKAGYRSPKGSGLRLGENKIECKARKCFFALALLDGKVKYGLKSNVWKFRLRISGDLIDWYMTAKRLGVGVLNRLDVRVAPLAFLDVLKDRVTRLVCYCFRHLFTFKNKRQ
jgi:hypothetical protein